MISSIANLVYKLPHESPNDLRLRILGNKEVLGQSQIWVETSPWAVSLLEIKLGNNSQKLRKSRYQTFLFLSSFPGFLYFVPNILPKIVWPNKVLFLTRLSLLQTLIFWHFVYYQRISTIIKENIKQVSWVKPLTLMVLC